MKQTLARACALQAWASAKVRKQEAPCTKHTLDTLHRHRPTDSRVLFVSSLASTLGCIDFGEKRLWVHGASSSLGSGTVPVMATTSSGLVPHVTLDLGTRDVQFLYSISATEACCVQGAVGAMSAASMLISLSNLMISDTACFSCCEVPHVIRSTSPPCPCAGFSSTQLPGMLAHDMTPIGSHQPCPSLSPSGTGAWQVNENATMPLQRMADFEPAPSFQIAESSVIWSHHARP